MLEHLINITTNLFSSFARIDEPTLNLTPNSTTICVMLHPPFDVSYNYKFIALITLTQQNFLIITEKIKPLEKQKFLSFISRSAAMSASPS